MPLDDEMPLEWPMPLDDEILVDAELWGDLTASECFAPPGV
jgi:hypothetical protein